jgi:hypothetical protein
MKRHGPLVSVAWACLVLFLALLALAASEKKNRRTVYLVTNDIETARTSILDSAAVAISSKTQADAYAAAHGEHVFEVTIRRVK